MKRIRIFLMAVLSVSLLLTACQNDFDFSSDEKLIDQIAESKSKKTVDAEDLPTAIVEEIKACYFETYVTEASKVDKKGYEIKLGSGEKIYFNMSNEMLISKELITECGTRPRMQKDCPFGEEGKGNGKPGGHGQGMGGGHGGHGGHGGDGTCDSLGNGNHPHPPHGDTLAIDQLPQAIIDYIAANYPDDEIFKAKLLPDAYIIKLTSPKLLKFDLEGNFVEELPFIPHHCHGIPIAIEDLPEVISTYITTNYPNAEIKQAFEHPDRIEVRLLNDGVRTLLMFDKDGNFLFVRTCE